MRRHVDGLLLAAGAGRRYGGPKALVPGALVHAVTALRDGGCDTVTVVLGAAFDEAATLVPRGVRVVRAIEWRDGMGASLRAGLRTLDGDAALVHLVDLPGVGAEVVARLVPLARPDVLARAVYLGTPGHPVLIGSAHFGGVADAARGDRGARDYLAARAVTGVECGDLATGTDVDHPPS